MINYKEMKLTKAEVLASLYNNSKPLGLGELMYVNGNMSIEDAEELLKETTYFDYLFGRVMKIDLSNDESFEERLYDRDNGEGAALNALNDYIASKNKTL